MTDKILCELGRQDIPVIQEQPEFIVDLLDTNLLLFGSSMSGKTNFIKLLVTILHKQYRETEEQIFILDFGGALAEFESLPLVAAYFDNANEEYVKRVFKLMEDQLKDNNKKLKGKNYRNYDGDDSVIHTTLFIDNVNAFLDEPRYTAYQEKLAKLCRDGLSKGITIVLTASSTKGLLSYMSSFKQKIALEMPADSYADIFSHKVIPVGNNPGHGYANVTVKPENITGTFPMQLAYELQLNYADDINSETFQENLYDCFENRSVTKYERFPEILTEEEYKKFTPVNDDTEDSNLTISVGLDYTECKAAKIDFESSRVVAIYGKKGFGKTNLLRRIIKELLVKRYEPKQKNWNFVLFDDGREQLLEFSESISDITQLKYIQSYLEENMLHKTTQIGEIKPLKLSPIQRFIKHIHESYMDLSQIRRASNLIFADIFGAGFSPELKEEDKRNTIFILQSKYLYVNSLASQIFMTIILPLMVARADEMNWIFIFSDVKNISDSDTRENFHSTIGTAFLLDNIAEFVGERGSKSVFGPMDVKSLKEEYAHCEEGDGYLYSIEKDDLKKLKFIREPEPETKEE